ncbi:hypothetical protein SAMD00023353_0700310 [Rosellinia necatrix]|uniref:Uncharacterized protein n=1 Tax=Rosellinia necatrix TaxID=77044 RepID=A0A1S8A5S4_ROSNE|nr:hypothetical protein SAMD00023353_0700310 [Rosellinia necatrix]
MPDRMPEPSKSDLRSTPNHPAPTEALPGTQRVPRAKIPGPAYKQAASHYTRFMIAMPILLVTSYYLFDRLALGHEAKSLHGTPVVDGVDRAKQE